MKKFILPGAYEFYPLNISLLELIKSNPEFFEDIEISAIFGNFQFCSWDGGRVFPKYEQASYELIEKIVKIYNKIYNVPVRLVFTSNTIEEKDLHDRFNNLVLEICSQSGQNEIVISSSLLHNYIKNKFPSCFKFISSTTKCLNSIEQIKEELKDDDFYMVCLDYNLNKNKKLLFSVSDEEKEKMEFLINANCKPGCPNRKNHYYLNSLFTQTYGKNYNMSECHLYENNFCEGNNKLTPEEVNYYYNNGFNNFKIEGRTFPVEQMILILVDYLVKEEYKKIVLHHLFEKIKQFNIYNYNI